MKKLVLAIALMTGTMMSFAQNRDENRDRDRDRRNNPPVTVTRSWTRDYPNNNDVQWERSGNYYRARYGDRDHNNRNTYVYYDRNGRRVQSYGEWDRNDVPEVVRQRIATRYRNYPNYNVYRIERPGRGFLFQISLGSGNGARKVYYDENGREVRYSNPFNY
jgi:uncharacterized protein YxeA